LREVGVHEQLTSVRTTIDNILPEAATVASQPSDKILFPFPLIRMPVLKIVDGTSDSVKTTMRQVFAKSICQRPRSFFIGSAMKHEHWQFQTILRICTPLLYWTRAQVRAEAY